MWYNDVKSETISVRCRLKHCDKCGTFYNDQLDQCPKCFPAADFMQESEKNAKKPDRKTLRNQWIVILIGIPLMILLYYLIIDLLKAVAS